MPKRKKVKDRQTVIKNANNTSRTKIKKWLDMYGIKYAKTLNTKQLRRLMQKTFYDRRWLDPTTGQKLKRPTPC